MPRKRRRVVPFFRVLPTTDLEERHLAVLTRYALHAENVSPDDLRVAVMEALPLIYGCMQQRRVLRERVARFRAMANETAHHQQALRTTAAEEMRES